ncbi:hypothetical protein, partial [Desulfovibrio sp.]|uniref:hypothetical protein n=1 Tax=Desulfovibrio sp. TaxID=885 RepID=UPI003076F872
AFFPAIPQYPGKQLGRKVFCFYNILILFILCLKNNFSAKKIPFCPFSSAKSVLSTIPLRDRSNGLRRS